MRNLLSVSDDISAKVLFIIEEDGRDAGYLKACTMWNMDATIEHVPFQGYRKATQEQYDVVVVDDYMANKSGYTLAMEILDRKDDVTMFMMGKDMDDISVVGAYRMGIADYMPIATPPVQLMAKCIASVNHRRKSVKPVQYQEDGRIAVSDVILDTKNSFLEMDGEKIVLMKMEALVLQVLMESADVLVSRKDIYEKAWGLPYVNVRENTVAMHISKLRRKMKDDGEISRYIETKWGEGYRFLSHPRNGIYH